LRDARTRAFNDRPPDPDIQIQEFPLVVVGEGSPNETPSFKKESFEIGEVRIDRD
jgi:hypothetical protein